LAKNPFKAIKTAEKQCPLRLFVAFLLFTKVAAPVLCQLEVKGLKSEPLKPGLTIAQAHHKQSY
jgi:hypothetical protein